MTQPNVLILMVDQLNGTFFPAGDRQVFTVSDLNDTDSDLWLYTSAGGSSPRRALQH